MSNSQIAAYRINHIGENIRLSGKIHKIHEIQLAARSLARDKVIEEVKEFNEQYRSEHISICKR